MKEEEKRIKIAEACGFKRTEWPYVYWYNPDHILCDEGHTITDPEDFPDYFNDLDACHEMEKALHKNLQLWWDYCAHLGRLTVNDLGDQTHIHASSSVRAEAFGITLKLWEGES